MDIKGPLEKYENFYEKCEYINDIKKIEKRITDSIKIITNSKIDYEFRSTILPFLHTKEDVLEMAKMIADAGAKKFYLQQFRPKSTLNRKLQKEKPFSEKEMLELRDLCRKYVNTEVRMA
jgi:pyruvate formate lyase activating enzyme